MMTPGPSQPKLRRGTDRLVDGGLEIKVAELKILVVKEQTVGQSWVSHHKLERP
jgi:hypothetical protein